MVLLTSNHISAFKNLAECISYAIKEEAEGYINDNKAFHDITSDKILLCSDNLPMNFIPEDNLIIMDRYVIESVPSDFIDWFKNGCEVMSVICELSGCELIINIRYNYGHIIEGGYLSCPNDGGTNWYRFVYNCVTKMWEIADN